MPNQADKQTSSENTEGHKDLLDQFSNISEEDLNKKEEPIYLSGATKTEAKKLFQHGYQSASDISKASQNELTEIEGITNALAARIKAEVDSIDNSDSPQSDEDGEDKVESEDDDLIDSSVSIYSTSSYLIGTFVSLAVILLLFIITTSALTDFQVTSVSNYYDDFTLSVWGLLITSCTVATIMTYGWYSYKVPSSFKQYSRIDIGRNITTSFGALLPIYLFTVGLSIFDLNILGTVFLLFIGVFLVYRNTEFVALTVIIATCGSVIQLFIEYILDFPGTQHTFWGTFTIILLGTLTPLIDSWGNNVEINEKIAETATVEKKVQTSLNQYNKKAAQMHDLNIPYTDATYDAPNTTNEATSSSTLVISENEDTTSYTYYYKNLNNISDQMNEFDGPDEVTQAIGTILTNIEPTRFDSSDIKENYINRIVDDCLRILSYYHKNSADVIVHVQEIATTLSHINEEYPEEGTADAQRMKEISNELSEIAEGLEQLTAARKLQNEAQDRLDEDEYQSAIELHQELRDITSNNKYLKTDELKTIEEIDRKHVKCKIENIQEEVDNINDVINSGSYTEARMLLNETNSNINSINERIRERGFETLKNEIKSIEQQYHDLITQLDEREAKKNLSEKITFARSQLEKVHDLINKRDSEQAQEIIKELASDIESAKEAASQYDFDDLYDELSKIEKRRKNYLKDISREVKSNPVPDTIPKEPDISVNYDALTDEEAIGGGGNADVTKATFSTSDGDVTLGIKEPRMSGTLHTEVVERMLKEAEKWDKLDDHDHIVGAVDYGSEPIPWIAMEYMDAGHLGARSGELGIPQALWTSIAITKGMRHAHRRGVAHLDLKPENILFRYVKGAWDVPKVTDWGLSKHLLNHSKSVEGLSPQYAAPEQFDDDFGSADDITDIYQLGTVFYELFTGQPPFEGKPAKAMHKVLHEQPTPPSEIADVPEELDDILLTALAKEKSDRYDNAAYLRDALQDVYDES